MTAGPRPRLADTFPGVAAEIVRLLRERGDLLADTVEDLLFYGVCTCSARYANLLTAPPGSSGSYVVQLECDGGDVSWLSLDPTATTITAIEHSSADLTVDRHAAGQGCDSPRRLRIAAR